MSSNSVPTTFEASIARIKTVAVRKSSFVHGLRARRELLHTECPQTYEETIRRFGSLLVPSTPAEERLVRLIAGSRWRLQRAQRLESLTIAAAEHKLEDEQRMPSPSLPLALRHLQLLAVSQHALVNHLDWTRLTEYETRLTGSYQGVLRDFRLARPSKCDLHFVEDGPMRRPRSQAKTAAIAPIAFAEPAAVVPSLLERLKALLFKLLGL